MSSEKKYKAKFEKKFGNFCNDCLIGMTLVYGRIVRMSYDEKEAMCGVLGYDDVDDHLFSPTDSSSDTYVEGHKVVEMYPVPNPLWRALAERWDQDLVITLNDLAPYEKVGIPLDDYCDQSEMEEDDDGNFPYDDRKLDFEKKAVYYYFHNHPADKNKPQKTPYSDLVDKYKVSDTYDYYIVPNGF